jgi:hypothetical protein
VKVTSGTGCRPLRDLQVRKFGTSNARFQYLLENRYDEGRTGYSPTSTINEREKVLGNADAYRPNFCCQLRSERIRLARLITVGYGYFPKYL